MLYLITAAVGGLVFSLILLAYLFLNSKHTLIIKRLEHLTSDQQEVDVVSAELSVPLGQRVIKPLMHFIAGKASKTLPEARRKNLEQKLILAGSPGNLSPQEFLGLKYTLTIALGLIGAAVFSLKGLGQVFFGGGAGIFLGLLGTEFYLRQLMSKRQAEITKSLPSLLDLLTVSVEAGLGFDAALAKVVEKTSGIMAHEFRRVLQEIKMGKPRREALKALSQRVALDDLTNLISAIIQADQLGVSMSQMLRVQSQQMRQKRRQWAEEQAMKAPIKMLLPLVFFVFPVIFIVLLGPALIQLFNAFAK